MTMQEIEKKKYGMTLEKIEQANNKMSNGFTLDMRSLLYHKEKEPVKQIEIDDTHYYEFKLCYMPEKADRYTYTGNKIPMLHISKWKNVGGGIAQSNGIGKWVRVGESVKRGTLANLIKYTKAFTTEQLWKIAEDNAEQLNKSTVF